MIDHHDSNFDLRQNNYKYSDTKQARRATLTSITHDTDIPMVIRQLNSIRNTASNSKVRNRLESDVKF